MCILELPPLLVPQLRPPRRPQRELSLLLARGARVPSVERRSRLPVAHGGVALGDLEVGILRLWLAYLV